MICNNCGKFVPDDARYCDACGMQQLGHISQTENHTEESAPLGDKPAEEASPAVGFEDAPTGPVLTKEAPAEAPVSQLVSAPRSENNSPSYPPQRPAFYPPPFPPYKQKAMSPGQYILYFLLMALPVVNFILIVVWSFSERTNENRRNLSRAMLAFTFIFLMAALGCLVAYALGAFPFRTIEIRLVP